MLVGLSVFDAHCDTVSRCYRTGERLFANGGMVSLEKSERAFSRYCQFFALFANCAKEKHPTYEQLRACFRSELDANRERIQACRTGAEAHAANKAGKAAAFLTVEGGELLGCDPEQVCRAAADGVVAVNLTWNNANAISGSCREETDRGISAVGRRFVEKLEEFHILPDVSHISDRGFWDLTEIYSGPILASHSNARAIWAHPRNLSDEQIAAVIRSGGLIGLNFYRDFVGRGEDFDSIYAHADHILSLGGSSNLGLGGDWDGCDTVDELPAIDCLSNLYEYLLSRNLSEEILLDLFYNNLMRVVSLP